MSAIRESVLRAFSEQLAVERARSEQRLDRSAAAGVAREAYVREQRIAHASLALAGVAGVPDVVHGENVRTFVVLRPDGLSCTTAELIAFARARIGYKAPGDIIVLETMPLTATDKVARGARSATRAVLHD